MSSRLPLIVILGATGTGKTKLSLELAQKFRGEIIGADSMQVYKGLDIITAKATKEELSTVPHHLIDTLEPNEEYTVCQYRNAALKVINDLMKEKKLPIIVGGTNYYIEALLWKILVDNPEDKVNFLPNKLLPNNEHELSSEELHAKLKILDPSMAKRLHPNNKRKILRSLEILHFKGKKHSDIIKEQHESQGASQSGGGLRFTNAIVFWLQCDKEILDKRLNSRVDEMLKEGLIDELTKFRENVFNSNKTPDYTKGILQSIGFKEFHSYLLLNTDEERNSEEGTKKFNEGVEQLKLVTRRYARKQNKWITNRFLGRIDRQIPPIYGLNTTIVSEWHNNVTVPAFDIVSSNLNNVECKYSPLPQKDVPTSKANVCDDTFTCEICDRVFVGLHQWTQHLKSSRHKKRKESKIKREKLFLLTC